MEEYNPVKDAWREEGLREGSGTGNVIQEKEMAFAISFSACQKSLAEFAA